MRTSKSYVMTVDVNSAADMEKLNIIKQAVAITNENRTNKKRVVLRGRKPIKKMPVPGGYFHRGSFNPVSYDWAGNIVGGLKNASMLDVYIYRR
jgi:hypothetical protein